MKNFFEITSTVFSIICGIASIVSVLVNITYSKTIKRFPRYIEILSTIIDKILGKTLDKIIEIDFDILLKKRKKNISASNTNQLLKQKYQEKKFKMKDSIIEELLNKKKKTYNNAIKLIFIAASIYCIISIIFDSDIKMEIIMFLDIFVVLIIISQLLIRYRIKKGYFGTNYEEAREIFIYLMENNDNGDKNSGKKIFNEIDENKDKDIMPVPVPTPDGGL